MATDVTGFEYDDSKPHTTVKVVRHQQCDYCHHLAHYDAKSIIGPWAYMCQKHYEKYGVGLGLGYGQVLVYIDSNQN